MRILIVAIGVFAKGGIERYTRYQYQALQELYGKENIFLASMLGEDKSNSFEDKIAPNYVQGGRSYLDQLTYIIKCIRLAKQQKVDVVICNLRQLSIIGYLCKKLFGLQYLTNVYGLDIWSGMSRIQTMTLLKSDRIIGDCNFIISYIEQHFNYPKSNMDLLYDAVDINRFLPGEKNDELYDKYGIPKNKFVITTIGRLERNKGHEVIIKTLRSLDESIIYLIVGGGKFMDSFKNLVATLNLEDRVFFAGRVPENELVDFYNLADLIVLLSIFSKDEGEGLPLGLIEASACGKPIICGNEDGSQDAISTNLPNGQLINPRDQLQLKEAVELYFNNEDKRLEHGSNGRKYVMENFEYEKFKVNQKQSISNLG